MRMINLSIWILSVFGCGLETTTPVAITNKLSDDKRENKKSYNIKNFLSFTNGTTYTDVIKYFNSKSLNYIEDIDLSSFKYYRSNEFPISTAFVSDCDNAKFMWVPALTVGDLTFSNVLFCFNQNRLCFITLFELTINRGANMKFEYLRGYYVKKYGDEGEVSSSVDTLDGGQTIFQRTTSKYKNYKDSLTVFLHTSYKDVYASSDINTYCANEVTIYFSNYENLVQKCRVLRQQLEKQKIDKRKEKEQKVLENL